ncbi:MAG: alpha-E domain-containing protein [Bryobacterales bacterium]
MLSRVAESIYWLNRYIERAENVARLVDVNLHLLLDLPEMFEGQWDALVHVSGDYEDFKERHGEANQSSVIEFLTFDRENPSSILSSVMAARENARSTREIITSETWEAINEFYLSITAPGAKDQAIQNPHEFFRGVRRASHLVEGANSETSSRNEGWHFARMGRSIERADKTTRILDIKYFLLLPDISHVGTAVDDIHWGAVLRSAGAFEMYRKAYGKVTANSIVRFLLLDAQFPRSVRHCLTRMDKSLHMVTGTPERSYSNSAERRLGQFLSELEYADERDIMRQGLHEYLDMLQTRINEVGDALHETFFALKPVTEAAAG